MNSAPLMAAAPALPSELIPIAELCTGQVSHKEEGTGRYIYMEKLRFLARGTQKEMDALLCLNYSNPTYPTKLYLSENLGLSLNWNESAYLFAKSWVTWSWKDVSQNQPPVKILAAHLEAFK